jgi:hypothetical protein
LGNNFDGIFASAKSIAASKHIVALKLCQEFDRKNFIILTCGFIAEANRKNKKIPFTSQKENFCLEKSKTMNDKKYFNQFVSSKLFFSSSIPPINMKHIFLVSFQTRNRMEKAEKGKV